MGIQATAAAAGEAVSSAASSTVDAVKSVPRAGYQRAGTVVIGVPTLYPIVEWICSWIIPASHAPSGVVITSISSCIVGLGILFIKGRGAVQFDDDQGA
jgi:hypothetical protein